MIKKMKQDIEVINWNGEDEIFAQIKEWSFGSPERPMIEIGKNKELIIHYSDIMKTDILFVGENICKDKSGCLFILTNLGLYANFE